MEEEILAAYKETLQKRKRAEDDLKAYENQYVGLLTDKARKEVLQASETPAGLSDMIESFVVEDSGNEFRDGRDFKVVFKDGIEASGDAFNVNVVLDGETYSVNIWDAKYEMEKRKEYGIKHQLKKVRETLNRLLPFLMYLSANFKKINPRELRKTAIQKLSAE